MGVVNSMAVYDNNGNKPQRRAMRKPSKKEIIIELVICLAILGYFGLGDTIGSLGKGKGEEAQPTQTAGVVSNDTLITAETIGDVSLGLKSSEAGWALYPYTDGGKQYYTLITLGYSNDLQAPGYLVDGDFARVNAQGDVGAQLISLVPKGDNIYINEQDVVSGKEVEKSIYAALAEKASNHGLRLTTKEDLETKK